jgi:hypothetical protein
VATSATESPTGEVIQSWASPELARELKQLAEQERRSVSAVIRIRLEEQSRKNERHEKRNRPAQTAKFKLSSEGEGLSGDPCD